VGQYLLEGHGFDVLERGSGLLQRLGSTVGIRVLACKVRDPATHFLGGLHLIIRGGGEEGHRERVGAGGERGERERVG